MTIKKGSGGGASEEGIVTIKVIDDTAAGLASAQASIDGAGKKISDSANKAGKSLGGLGDSAKKATDKAGTGFANLSGAAQQLAGGMGKVPGALSAVAGGLTKLLPGVGAAVGLITAGVAAFDAWATESDAARKATVSMQISIDGARDAFGGMISDMDLARMGNKAFALGVVENGVQFEALARGVSAIAMNLGEDAAQLMDNAATAIGRGSALILDNLGIILDSAKAEEIYAASLGKTVKELTAYEKSQSFAKAATLEIAKAGNVARASIDGLGNSYAKAKVQLENFKNGVVGFGVNVGKVRDTVRTMAPEVLALFGSRQREDIGAINRELAKRAEEQAAEARALGDLNAKAEDYRITYEDILSVADELGQVEKMRGGQIDFENRKKREVELNRLAQEALNYQDQAIKKADAQAKIAERDAKVKRLHEEADTLDHQAKLLEFQKGKEGEILMLQAQALNARKEAAELVKDQNAALEQQRALELLLAAPMKKKGGGGSGPTEADRVKAAGQAAIDFLQSEAQYAEVIARIRGTEAADALEIGKMRLEAADAALELERQTLEVTRAKNSVERTNIDNRISAIDRERELLGLQRQADERAAANDLVGKAIDDQAKLAAIKAESRRQDSEELGRVIQLEQFRLTKEEQGIRSTAAMRTAAATTDIEKQRIAAETEAALHANRLRQLDEEHKVKLRTLSLREDTIRNTVTDDPLQRLQLEDELKQTLHDREIERQNYELAVEKAKAAEEVRLFNERRARLQEQLSTVESSVSGLSQLYSQASDFAAFFNQQAAAGQEAEVARTVAALNAKGQAQRIALDREIQAARGNIALQNELRRRGAKNEADIQQKIEAAQNAHLERQRKAEAKAAGFKLLIDGVVNAAKAVSAYASFNFVQGVLYTAAAAFNFAQGGILLAGGIPNAGASAGAATAGGGGSSGFDRESSAANKVPGSVPGEAARRSTNSVGAAANAGGGTTVIINGDINAWGAIDDDVTERIAFKLKETGKSREGAAA
jgi:hypothetical protein